MGEFVISCCSTAELTEEHFNTRKISYICFHYELDGKEYADDLGKSLPFDKFYQAMMNGAQTKTSQVNAESLRNILKDSSKREKISCMYACHQESQA